ncbi:MAG: DUF5318 family protein [Mycobacteriales bacterium]|nr:DUF5318 domain-containing protein [Frankia sp.]
MRSRRAVIDYALAKRATLGDLFGGRATVTDVCDAHPYLLRAAKYRGETTAQDCPVCRREPLTHVTYVYGDELRDAAGGTRTTAELAEMESRYREFAVYVVEVCRRCGWNHLHTSYLLGAAAAAAGPSKRTGKQRQAGQA